MKINDPYHAEKVLRSTFTDFSKEQFVVAYCDQELNVLKRELHSNGDDWHVDVNIPAILDQAKSLCAKRLFVAHSHPDNNVTPSVEDIQVTGQLSSLGHKEGVNLIEHFVVAPSGGFSLITGAARRFHSRFLDPESYIQTDARQPSDVPVPEAA